MVKKGMHESNIGKQLDVMKIPFTRTNEDSRQNNDVVVGMKFF